MAAPSSTPRDHHLVRDPRKQTATARSKEKASFKRIQCKTSEKLRSHVSKRRLANCFRNTSASQPSSPSTEKHSGVKLARRSEQAVEYLRFFSASAEAKTFCGE